MRAVQIIEYGGPEVVAVRDIEEPLAADGQVLLDVEPSGVNLAPFGRLAFYGMASLVEPEKVSLRALQRQSATISGFWLTHTLARPASLAAAYAELAAQTAPGALRVIHGGDYPMSQVKRAHNDLRNRRTTGKLVIDPSR